MIGGLDDPADDGLGEQGVEDLVEQMLGSHVIVYVRESGQRPGFRCSLRQ